MKFLGLHALFDLATSTLTYILWEKSSRAAVLIDPVLNFDPVTQMVSNQSVRQVLDFVSHQNLQVEWILETHAHADHFSSARELRARWPGARWAMSSRMSEVFATFHKLLAWPKDLKLQSLGVDRFLSDGEELTFGSGVCIQAIGTPGHTAACLSFLVESMIFTGDALMMADAGVGRCDFSGGSANQLYDSVWGRLYSLPDHVAVFVGHDYSPGGRPMRYRTTISQEREFNIHLSKHVARADFIAFREGRDKTLKAPRLLGPSLDWNLGAHQIVKRNT